MTEDTKSVRPALPRDAFRSQRALGGGSAPVEPVVVTPTYDDPVEPVPTALPAPAPLPPPEGVPARRPKRQGSSAPRNPFEVYGERSSSRPYALRLPDAVDFVIRQMAAEERTQPLRIVDRILHDHLQRIGRHPPRQGA